VFGCCAGVDAFEFDLEFTFNGVGIDILCLFGERLFMMEDNSCTIILVKKRTPVNITVYPTHRWTLWRNITKSGIQCNKSIPFHHGQASHKGRYWSGATSLPKTSLFRIWVIYISYLIVIKKKKYIYLSKPYHPFITHKTALYPKVK
jgi:hypothetical protein